MTMLAHQASFPASLGMGPTQIPSTREYTSVPPSHRTPVIGNTQNGPFASPTESEFSDPSEGHDSVRYVLNPERYSLDTTLSTLLSRHSFHKLQFLTLFTARGMKSEWANG